MKEIVVLNEDNKKFYKTLITLCTVSYTHLELIELSSVPPLANNKELANEVTGYMKDIVGEQGIFLFEGGGMGSEDFASYSYEVPSLYVILGAGAKNENPLYGVPMHNEKVVFNEDVLPTGAAMHAYSAIMWLKNNK